MTTRIYSSNQKLVQICQVNLSGLESIKYTQFQYDLVNNVDMETLNNQRHKNIAIHASPGNKLFVAIKAVEKLITDFDYSLFRGEMFRKSQRGSIHSLGAVLLQNLYTLH